MSEYEVVNNLALDAVKDSVPCPPDRWGEPYERITEYRDGLDDWNCGEATCEIKEPIVRCRDCRHELDGWCFRPDGDGDFMRFRIEQDGFCKWGERK